MKTILLSIAFLLAAGAAQAQTPPKYNLNTAQFEHTWAQAPNTSPATEWRYNCGPKSGGYTLVTKVNYAAPTSGSLYDVPAKTVLSNIPGVYFCVVKAANDFGESGPTNEVSGEFGLPPPSGSSLTIVNGNVP